MPSWSRFAIVDFCWTQRWITISHELKNKHSKRRKNQYWVIFYTWQPHNRQTINTTITNIILPEGKQFLICKISRVWQSSLSTGSKQPNQSDSQDDYLCRDLETAVTLWQPYKQINAACNTAYTIWSIAYSMAFIPIQTHIPYTDMNAKHMDTQRQEHIGNSTQDISRVPNQKSYTNIHHTFTWLYSSI